MVAESAVAEPSASAPRLRGRNWVAFGIFAAVLIVFGVTQLLGLQSPKDKSVYILPTLHDKKILQT